MNPVLTLDRFFDLDGPSSAQYDAQLSLAFSKLKPEGRPKFPGRHAAGAFDIIGDLAREATDAIDCKSSRAAPHEDREAFAQLLVAALIAAAKSDQRLAEKDLGDIAALLGEAAVRDESVKWIRDEILRPMMIEHVTRRSWTRAETVELYTASRLATDARDELSDHYLKMLAARLGLEQAMTDSVEAAIFSRR